MSRRIEIGQYLVADPEICHGQITFKGTRIPVIDILEGFQEGLTIEEVLREWSGLSREAILEAFVWAADQSPDPLEPAPALRAIA